jgi:glycerophosphoryl diester phosphodiesterase
LPTGWLAGRSVSWEEAVRSTREGEHEFLLPHAATLNGVAGARRIRAAHTAGLLVLPWTVDDAVEAARLAAAGIDGVITNRPDAILSVLGEHRHRHGG